MRSPVGFSSAGHGQSLPAAPAPPGIIAGAAGSTCPPGLVAGVWSASSSARPSQPEIHVIDPLRVHFSLHGLGEYDACQAELLALLALNPSSRGVGQGATGADGVQAVSDHLFIRPVETRPVQGILGAVSTDDEHK